VTAFVITAINTGRKPGNDPIDAFQSAEAQLGWAAANEQAKAETAPIGGFAFTLG